MNTVKRVSALIFAVFTLTLFLCSCSREISPDELESAEYVTSEANELYEYKIYKKFAVITRYLGDEAKIIIPEKLGGKTVRSIGDYAFYVDDAAVSITIPDTVVSIGDSAFWGCTSLKSIEIPKSVKELGTNAFRNCSALEAVIMADGGVTTIGKSCFEYCTALTSVNIPESVTKIGDNAFLGCIVIKTLSLPSSVAEIGNSAFGNCPDLILKVVKDSYGNQYANENGLSFIAT